MKYVQYLTVLGLLLLVAVQGAHAAEGAGDMRSQVKQMRQEHAQQRQELRQGIRDDVSELHDARKEEADALRQDVREELKDATSAAQRRAIIKDAMKKRSDFKEASMAARQSLWDTIRGKRWALRTQQQQERSSLFDKFISLFSAQTH